jgi:Adenylate and Guanylate cyclase catalytic domain
MTTHVSDKPDSAWPLVYFPDWKATAKQAMSNTGARYIGFTPLVQDKDRFRYEMFMLENRQGSYEKTEHHEEALAQAAIVQAGLASNIGLEPQSFVLTRPIPFIFQGNSSGIFPAQAEVYAPVAQVAPLPHYMSYLNFDGFGFPLYQRIFDGMVVAKRAVLSEVLNYDEYFTDDASQTSQTNLTVVAEVWSPASFMLAPIYDRLEPGAALVGALAAEMPWDSYFSNLIPEGIDGIVLVVRNTCGQQATYEINGPEVTYLGLGDWHDPRYDEFEVLSDFETAFTSLPECIYSIHLYPSEEFEMAYQSNQPRVYALAVAGIFVLVSLIFVMYDWMVERRQEKVMHTAVRSSDIVNSLFPANVRDRLMDDAMQQRQEQEAASPTARNHQHPHPHQQHRNSIFANLVSAGATSILNSDKDGNGLVAPSSPPSTPGANTTKGKLTSFAMIPSTPRPRRRSSTSRSLGGDSRTTTTSPFLSRPIADLFPNSTVLFGDLVGFTAWSSVRQPSQVFILLETLYYRFDQTAKKFGVFKVETIGDCYGRSR